MIVARATRLVRTADLRTFRAAVVNLATTGRPLDARNRLVIVPTRAAANHLLRSMEDAGAAGALVHPDIATPGELITRLAWRLDDPPAVLTEAEREALLGVSCREAEAAGVAPPFRMRPALVAEALRFYDDLRRHRKDVDAFERLVLGTLEPGASYDRGAARLVQQTRFLVDAFRRFEGRCREIGLDEHALRERLLVARSRHGYRHVVVTVTSRRFGRYGVNDADWDLLARMPGVESLDVVITDRALAGAPHEWVHTILPGIEETRFEAEADVPPPGVLATAAGGVIHVARDREDEVADFARRVRRFVTRDETSSVDRAALVVNHPLPYVYVCREVFRAAATPCQMFDALPLAAEPHAAACDLVLSFAASGFARTAAVALMRSPHFSFGPDGHDVESRDVEGFDRLLSEAGYLGGLEALERLIDGLQNAATPQRGVSGALRVGRRVLDLARELSALRESRPVSEHLDTVLEFWRRYERATRLGEVVDSRLRRGRAALLGLLTELRDAYQQLDSASVGVEDVAALIHRWIEGRTFAPPADEGGLHVVDAESAPYGEFELVQLAGLIEGEWPSPPRQETFYSRGILRDLGWPSEHDRTEGIRAAFEDLVHLPARYLAVSTFRLEMDALVSPSPLLDVLQQVDLDAVEEADDPHRIFDHEALALEPPALDVLSQPARRAAELRRRLPPPSDRRFHGFTAAHTPPSFSPHSLEEYQDCPFRFFAARVLRLDEPPDDGSRVTPRARGRLIHDVFRRFFELWDERYHGPLTPDRLDEAREALVRVAEPLLERLPESERVLESARLLGSPMAPGAADVLLGLEASHPTTVRRRWLEHRFEGTFALGKPDRAGVQLRAVADRIDLLEDGRLRIIDYKTGRLYERGRALQVSLYAWCARERFLDDQGRQRSIATATYVTLADKRPEMRVIGDDSRTREDAVLAEVSDRVYAVVDGVEAGVFPPRPHDVMRCRFCAFSSVCRKDYVDDD